MGRTVEPGSPPDADGAGPVHTERLIISHMVLENFKSYAGVQRVGPFHKVPPKASTQLPCRLWCPLPADGLRRQGPANGLQAQLESQMETLVSISFSI